MYLPFACNILCKMCICIYVIYLKYIYIYIHACLRMCVHLHKESFNKMFILVYLLSYDIEVNKHI